MICFHSLSGHTVKTYGEALQTHGFRPFAGEDASQQPPDIPDLLLHVTAIGCVRRSIMEAFFQTEFASFTLDKVKLGQIASSNDVGQIRTGNPLAVDLIPHILSIGIS